MEKAAAPGASAGCRWEIARCTAAVLVLCAAGPAAWAQAAAPAPAATVVAQANAAPPLRLEIEASALPRLEAQDSGFQAPRIDVSLFPARGRGVGAVLGMSGFSASTPPVLGAPTVQPSFDLGLRWTHELPRQGQIDITAWRRMQGSDDAFSLIQAREPLYGARVEMRLKPAKLGFLGFDRGFIGLQLEGGGRISIKRKDGVPMIYYRTKF